MAKKNNSVRVSVLMTVYNGSRYLAEAIDSILEQSFEDFEFIIIDDCSKDNSREIIEKYSDPRIRYYKNEKNLGLIGALNRGLGLAKGEYIARMDQDDIAKPLRFEKQLAFLDAHPKVVAVGTAMTLMSETGVDVTELEVIESSDNLKRALTVRNPFAHSSMIFSLEKAIEAGQYREEAYAAEDYDLWSRMAAIGELANIPESLMRYRLTPGGMSISLRQTQKMRSQMIADTNWIAYEPEGPAPLSAWSAMWPKNKSKLTKEKLRVFGDLHILFAKGYRRRGMFGLSFRHWLASFSWSSASVGAYFAILMFVLPYSAYAYLEEKLAGRQNRQRASKTSE